MILLHAPRSPFSFKVRIVLHELGLAERVRLQTVDPWKDESLRTHNPLCKVPTLVLDDGSAIYDSRVICDWLDETSGGLLTETGDGRVAVRRIHALADGLAEAVIRRFVERLGPRSDRSDAVILRQGAAIEAALDTLDRSVQRELAAPSVAQAAAVAALTYLSHRSPELSWRNGRERLRDWYDTASRQPAVLAARFGLPDDLPVADVGPSQPRFEGR